MSEVKRYYKKKLSKQNITVEYSSETDLIDIEIEYKLVNGTSIGTDRISIHPSYIEPLHALLKEVVEVES